MKKDTVRADDRMIRRSGWQRRFRPALALAFLAACTDQPSSPGGDFTAITFNVGTTRGLPHDTDTTDGYTSAEAAILDELYGNGLAWPPAIVAVAEFIAARSPAIVAFQEIFDSRDCASIPEAFWPGFVCETWRAGDPLVVEQVLGPDYQIACHLGKTDKCVAVRTDFGRFEDCSDSLCLDGLAGAAVPGCGSGSRVGRGKILRSNGDSITVAHIHATSGRDSADQACRVAQIEQLFVSLDGTPAADGAVNLVLGDFNTDPARAALVDQSAARLNDFVGPGERFGYRSPSSMSDPPSYQLAPLTIDHLISDSIGGACVVPGLTPGAPPVFAATYFDHRPIVCDLAL